MSDGHRAIKGITDTARRRRWSTEQKLEMVEETLHSDESISVIVRHRGFAPATFL
jgi:transposase